MSRYVLLRFKDPSTSSRVVRIANKVRFTRSTVDVRLIEVGKIKQRSGRPDLNPGEEIK